MENISTVLLLTWQSLVLILIMTSCSGQSTYYVTPTPDAPCPGEPCHTLSEYAAGQYFNNLPVNTTIEFLSGNHTLKQTITLANLPQLILYGEPSSLPGISSKIICTWQAGFDFTQIDELRICALAFISCGHLKSAAVRMRSVQHGDISNCTFQDSINTIDYYSGGALIVKDSTLTLTRNTFYNNSAPSGGALHIENSTLTLTRNTFHNNLARLVGGALKAHLGRLILTENTFQNNSAGQNGGAFDVYRGSYNLTGNTFQANSAGANGGALHVHCSILNITRNILQHNSAGRRGGAQYIIKSTLHSVGNHFQNSHAAFGGTVHMHISRVISTDDCFSDSYAEFQGGAVLATGNSKVKMLNISIGNNRAKYGGGMAAVDSRLKVFGNTFENNRARYGGGLYVHNTEIYGAAIITKNSADEGGGGIYASTSTFIFVNSTTIIANNAAKDGGGLLLSGDSKLYQKSRSAVHFMNNSAMSTGGAIKVEESNPLTYCIPLTTPFYVSNSECFFQRKRGKQNYFLTNFLNIKWYNIKFLNIRMYFHNNTAVESGSDLHGGSVDNCRINTFTFYTYYRGSTAISGYYFDAMTEKKAAISSDPLNICTCRDGVTNCSGVYHPEPVYPGGTLEVPVIARGQRNGTTTAVIEVIYTSNNISISNLEYSQSNNNNCNILKYTIKSHATGTAQKMTLYAEGPCSPTQTNTLNVTVNIQYCPAGYHLSKNDPICICAERLQKFTNTCLIDNKTVLREQNADFWVGYDSDIKSRGLILHPNCPFDYCTSEETYLAVEDSDKQCNYFRSGLLCGRCSDNLSLVLGSSRCLQCSDFYLSLVVAFALAGIALVFILLVLRLTVAAGTINGLIFYANILQVNSAIFFQLQMKTASTPTMMIVNVFSVFISWLNLDLGIETCFYTGMDACAKTWMQFAFPLYVWALVGLIIVGSHYSGRVGRIFGSNPIAVLATLFLLSYAKLLRTINAALSFTSLEYPNNLHTVVWFYDGNVRYLSGKHIPLFTAGMICLALLFLPYTLLLIFSQWLQAKSHLMIFSRINSRYVKPFLDAYHAPYTNKHRYWTGLMLLLRLILFLISAVNALGNPNVNLLATAFIAAAILSLYIVFGCRIYKTWSLGLLETTFIINLSILAVASLYVRLSGGNQNDVTFTSVGIASATFIGIVIYHSIQQLKGTRLWRRVSVPKTDVASGPDDPPDRVFVSGSAPTQTVVDLHLLREPCMETE